jgi:hypothetical protein
VVFVFTLIGLLNSMILEWFQILSSRITNGMIYSIRGLVLTSFVVFAILHSWNAFVSQSIEDLWLYSRMAVIGIVVVHDTIQNVALVLLITRSAKTPRRVDHHFLKDRKKRIVTLMIVIMFFDLLGIASYLSSEVFEIARLGYMMGHGCLGVHLNTAIRLFVLLIELKFGRSRTKKPVIVDDPGKTRIDVIS